MDAVYKVIEVVGSSSSGIEDAINKAIQKASETLNHLDWFEVVQTRGYINKEKVKNYQVILKIGFRLEGEKNSN